MKVAVLNFPRSEAEIRMKTMFADGCGMSKDAGGRVVGSGEGAITPPRNFRPSGLHAFQVADHCIPVLTVPVHFKTLGMNRDRPAMGSHQPHGAVDMTWEEFCKTADLFG